MTTPQLFDLMRRTERQLFVGRTEEQAMFSAALRADPKPFHVLHVHGPGGIGKSALLQRFAETAADHGLIHVVVDGQVVDPVVSVVEDMLDEAGVFDPGVHAVVLIDTWEQLAPLDDWVRASLVPRLSAQSLLVLAGRNPAAPAWRANGALWSLCRTLPLRRLSERQSRDYLERRDIPAHQLASVLRFTHGHPLALSLAADVAVNNPDQPAVVADDPNIIGTLVARLRIEAPDDLHRMALETAAVVPAITESIIADVVPEGDRTELFRWLTSLSFMRRADVGVAPHEVARHALVSDLRWRHPHRYREIHERARDHFSNGVKATAGVEQDRMVRGLMYLHRDNPVIAPFLDWDTMAEHRPGPARDGDVGVLVEMVRTCEGEDSARLAAAHLAHDLEGAVVIRGRHDEPKGFVYLASITAAEVSAGGHPVDDPAMEAALATLNTDIPLRPGESATMFRFWMCGDTYQDVGGVQSAVFAVVVRHYLAAPNLAATLFPVADPEFWGPGLAYADLTRLERASFTVGGRTYAVFGHDWRTRPPASWLGMLADRETSGQIEPPAERPEPLMVLSRDDLVAATTDALRHFTEPDQLATNPLLRSRVVIERASVDVTVRENVEVLRGVLAEVVEDLATTPRGTKQHRAIYHTFINPAPTQEAAAEAVHMPFSTYRRHLVAGRDAVAERMWRLDLGDG